jgi:hypothetical protein
MLPPFDLRLEGEAAGRRAVSAATRVVLSPPRQGLSDFPLPRPAVWCCCVVQRGPHSAARFGDHPEPDAPKPRPSVCFPAAAGFFM